MGLLAFCHKGGICLPLAGSIIMHLTIPLEQISVEDKLQAIEEIWADLAGTPENIPSPSWHADVLRAN